MGAQFVMRPLGDSALIVELAEHDADAGHTFDNVLRAQRCLQQAAIPGVTEITTAFATVAVFFDPARVTAVGESIFASLEAEVRSALDGNSAVENPLPGAEDVITEVPVCYEDEFGLDLRAVADHASITPDEVIRLHSSGEYRVAAVGFTPGFPYMAGLPPELATPRRATPRTSVPAGSVAIGGSQAGIYPMNSPGGWHIIGRTPLKLFDVASDRPALLRAGDRVRFRQITSEEFRATGADARLSEAQATGNK